MKIKSIGTAIAVGIVTSQASALTAVINLSGNVHEYISPDSLASYESFALSQQYVGQLVIKEFDKYFGYDRTVPGFVGQDAVINPSNDSTVGFTIGGTSFPQPYFEGGARFIKNDQFDNSRPACHYWEIGTVYGCTENTLNPDYRFLDTSGANFDALLGTAELSIVDGAIDSFNWSMDRTQGVETYDNTLRDYGVAFLMSNVNLELTNFEFISSDHEFVYFNADQHLSVEVVEDVPLPAAVWLFGSALLGLVGVKRK